MVLGDDAEQIDLAPHPSDIDDSERILGIGDRDDATGNA
jgi:hypothetical protein